MEIADLTLGTDLGRDGTPHIGESKERVAGEETPYADPGAERYI
jgi:hypothetical protein